MKKTFTLSFWFGVFCGFFLIHHFEIKMGCVTLKTNNGFIYTQFYFKVSDVFQNFRTI